VSLYPEEALCIPQEGIEPLFTEVRGVRILRTSCCRSSKKFGLRALRTGASVPVLKRK
jgi:hypothetical protein